MSGFCVGLPIVCLLECWGFGLIVVLLGFNAWVCFSTCGFCWLKFVFDSRCVVVVAFAGCGWFSLLLASGFVGYDLASSVCFLNCFVLICAWFVVLLCFCVFVCCLLWFWFCVI